jgi:transposase
VQCSRLPSRKKGSYCRAKYHSLKSRIGDGKAMLAIGHKLLISIWHVLTNGEVYRDLGEAHLDRRNQQQALKRYARKLDALGYIIVPKQEATAVAA